MITKNNLNNQDKKKFDIEKIPESTRKTIFKITITVLMIIIVVLWLFSFKASLNFSPGENSTDKEWQTIQQDLNTFIETTKKNFGIIKEQVSKLTEPTTTVELSKEEIEKLKEKLQELEKN